MDKWLTRIKKKKQWEFMRWITDLLGTHTIKGIVNWTLISNNIFKYKESGKFDNNEFSKEYIYDFKKKKVLFLDNTLFFDFSKQEAIHFCNNDIYKITYGDNYLQYDVSGPNKQYKSKTFFNSLN